MWIVPDYHLSNWPLSCHSLIPQSHSQHGYRSWSCSLRTLGPRQNGRHFPDDIFKCIFLNENLWILIMISLKFVPDGPINNIPPLVQIMAWRRPGDKPLSEPVMFSLLTNICVTWPQWVKDTSQWLSAKRYCGVKCLCIMIDTLDGLVQIYAVELHIDGLVQDCSNAIANTLELLQSYTKPSIYHDWQFTCKRNLLVACLLYNYHISQEIGICHTLWDAVSIDFTYFHEHGGNDMFDTMPVKQPWGIQVIISHDSIRDFFYP